MDVAATISSDSSSQADELIFFSNGSLTDDLNFFSNNSNINSGGANFFPDDSNFTSGDTDFFPDGSNFTSGDTDFYPDGSNITYDYDYTLYNLYDEGTALTEFYLKGVVVSIGLVFNTLALICFLTSKSLRSKSASHFLIVLTFVDTIYLVGEFLRWLNTYINEPYLGLTFMDDSVLWCKFIHFFRYFGMLASAWVTVLITCERYIVLTYPLKAVTICTTKARHISIAIVFILSLAVTLFPFWALGLIFEEGTDFTYCAYYNAKEYNIWIWIAIRIGSIFVPVVIILTFTPMILWKMAEMNRKRKELTQKKSHSSSLQHRLNIVLVCVAVCFIVFRVPYNVIYALHYFRDNIWTPGSFSVEKTLFSAKQLTSVLETLNYTIDFFLYCFIGTAFRNQFLALYCCRRRKMTKKYGTGISTKTQFSSVSSRSLATSVSSIPADVK